MPANLAKYKFVSTMNQVELLHFSKILLIIKNACDHCSQSSMIAILSEARFVAGREHGAFKMQVDHDHDKPCACYLNASTCTRVSELHCIKKVPVMIWSTF